MPITVFAICFAAMQSHIILFFFLGVVCVRRSCVGSTVAQTGRGSNRSINPAEGEFGESLPFQKTTRLPFKESK